MGLFFCFTFFFLKNFLLLKLLQMSPCPPFAHLTEPLSYFPLAFTILLSISMGYAYTLFSYSVCLFLSSLPTLPLSICQFVPCIHASGSIYSLHYFIYQIPHINELIQYLSFSDWLISPSIIISRYIHAVTKGQSYFFFTAMQYSIV